MTNRREFKRHIISRMIRPSLTFILLAVLLQGANLAQQINGQDMEKILERADKLFEEAKSAYERAREKGTVEPFVDAGFKLEEVRIKYIVLQEIGSPEKQKIAADRLRAINQLSKLIHDGKVAISGTPAESAPEKPAPAPGAPPPKAPAPGPPPAALKAPLDVTQRATVPDTAKQREAEKQIRELFKDQYSKKAATDRKALARQLLEQAAKSQDDPVGYFVLLREAQDIALQACDLKTAIEAIDAAGRLIDIDGLSMKIAALVSAGKAARIPEEFAAIALASQKIIDELVGADQFDAADKAAATAVQLARKSNDPGLATRVSNRAKEVSEAKVLYQSMKSAMESQARNPDDAGANLEIGRFLCFVKDSWDLGLRFLVKGSDAPLKSLAEKELTFPADHAGRIALADGWYALVEKEKSPLRKSRLLSHSASIYESAAQDAPALVRARVEKKLGEIEAALPGPINLLRMVDPRQDATKGTWNFEGRTLVGIEAEGATIMIPFQPPEEYDLAVTFVRVAGTDAIVIGLVAGGSQFEMVLDGHSGKGGRSGLELVDGKFIDQHSDVVTGLQVEANQTVTVVCSIRKSGIGVTLDGKRLINWQGNFSRLSMGSLYKVTNPKALFIGAYNIRLQVNKILLTSISGQGKKLR